MEIAVFFLFLDYCVKQMKLYGVNSADETKLLVGAFHGWCFFLFEYLLKLANPNKELYVKQIK